MARVGLIVASLALAATAAGAQNAPMPDFLKGKSGIRYTGAIAGMDSYKMDGFPGLWFVTPDGQNAIAGTMFTREGRDIGSMLSGSDPIKAFEMNTKGMPNAPQVMSEAPEQPNYRPGADEVAPEMPARPKADVAPVLMEASPDISDDLPAGLEGAQNSLKDLSPEERAYLIEAYKELTKDATSAFELESAVDIWVKEVVRVHQEGAGFTENDPNASDTTLETSPEEAKLTVQDGLEAFGQDLFTDIRHRGFWYSVGRNGAPVAYAIIDPTCKFCAEAIDNLIPMVDRGDLQLRVLLVPLVQVEEARGYISAILQSDNPALNFLEHEYARHRKTEFMPGQPWEDLPAPFRKGVDDNVKIVKAHGINQVPFFMVNTSDGPRTILGVPTEETFKTALPDSYEGLK